MKKISVAFDSLRFSKETMKYALDIASESKALISGVFLDDFLYHSYSAFGTPDSVGMQGVDIGQLQEQDQEIRRIAIATFDAACKERKLDYVIHHNKNFAMDELLKETVYSDLLIIGASETFNHYHDPAPSLFIQQLLAAAQCPVLVVPGRYRAIEGAVLLYDGKPSSMCAIKMFNYLMPWIVEKKTEVVTVDDPKEALEFPYDSLIKEFVKCHYTEAKYTLLQGDPQEDIPAYLKAAASGSMVVLGAYDRNRVSRWFKTSMADILINDLPVPVFIAH